MCSDSISIRFASNVSYFSIYMKTLFHYNTIYLSSIKKQAILQTSMHSLKLLIFFWEGAIFFFREDVAPILIMRKTFKNVNRSVQPFTLMDIYTYIQSTCYLFIYDLIPCYNTSERKSLDKSNQNH